MNSGFESLMLSNAKTTTYSTTRHVASYEWWRKSGGSTPPQLITHHVASCHKNCRKSCDTSITLWRFPFITCLQRIVLLFHIYLYYCHASNPTRKIGTWQWPHAYKVSTLQVCKIFFATKIYPKKLHQINPKYLNNFFINRSPIIRKE